VYHGNSPDEGATVQIMLSELQQRNVWEGWLGSEVRAHYFADLCNRFQQTQRFVTWSTLAASSGAAAAILSGLPQAWLWIRPVLALITAALSLWSLVSNYSKNATECSDLHLRWSTLAIAYEELWGNMYASTASGRLSDLRQQDAELSKSCTSLPNKKNLMLKWQRYIVDQRAPSVTA
jgi:hypothetical protein